jgi:hypothetical protein
MCIHIYVYIYIYEFKYIYLYTYIAVAFSPDGKMIAVAVQNENHSILLFDWKTAYLKANVDGGRQKVLCIAFSIFPPLPLGEETPPSAPGVSYAMGRLSLFPPNNSMVADTDIPVRIIQGGIGQLSSIVYMLVIFLLLSWLVYIFRVENGFL